MATCLVCGQDNPDGFKFCGRCGALLEPAAAAREQRKVVTVVFCDLTGSTALGDRTDPEALRATMRGYYEQMRAILERHGGTVEKFVGDAVMAVFGVPTAHEDDALRAVRAAWEMRDAIAGLELHARIGVNTGEVVAGLGETLVTGDAVNVAARLEQAAETGEVLIGALTRRLVRGAVAVEPVAIEARGKAEPVEAFRLLELDLAAPGIARRLDTRLIGRERELALLRHAFERCEGERSCHLVTVLGPAGVGKSRLVAEFLTGVDATVVRGRCLDYGDGITFWPVIEVLKQLKAETAVDTLAAGAATGDELFWQVRKVLEEVAASRPLVVVFDDIHWGESMFLDLIDHVADLSRGVPLLLLCIARPELLDDRPSWGGGKLNATTTLLESLSAEQAVELLLELGAGEVDEPTRERILSAGAGNPLFIEEMLAHALDGGDIRATATIQALLQARLDRLGDAERTVIERGAVEGEIFHRGAVLRLVNGLGDVDTQLVRLIRKELIRPDRTTFPGDEAFRFRHLLIRDVAYDSLPKETRADLHQRIAEWLATHVELIELDEIVGYHLEQAARYRAELGRPDPELSARAGAHLAAAGGRASRRGDITGVTNLLERALALLPEDDPRRSTAALTLAESTQSRGDFERHDELLAPLLASADPVVRANALVLQVRTRFYREPAGSSAAAEAAHAEAVPVLQAAGDTAGLAQAAMLRALPSLMACQGGRGTAALREAIGYARATGDRRTEGMAAQSLSGFAGHGPCSATELEQIVAELRGSTNPGPAMQAAISSLDGMTLMLRGDLPAARERYRAADELLAEIGWEVARGAHSMFGAEIELRDDPEAAVALLQHWADRLLELGVLSFPSTLFAVLAQAHYACGRPDAAAAAADRCEEFTADDDVVNFAIVNGIRGRIAADLGKPDEAHKLADEALRWALQTDFPFVRADAYRDLAHVLEAEGDQEGARAALESALTEYRLKEDDLMAALTEGLLADL